MALRRFRSAGRRIVRRAAPVFAAAAGRFAGKMARRSRRSSGRIVKRRRVRSSTSTSVKSVIPKSYPKPDGNGGSFSSFRTHRKGTFIPKWDRRMLEPSHYRVTTAARLTAAFGQQNATYFEYANQGDMQTPANQFAVSNFVQKVWYQKIYGTISITNQDKGNCHVTIYDLMCRRDLVSGNTLDPNSTWSLGLTDTNGSSATTKSITNLGVTPFQSPLFCQYYKVMKVSKFVLGQGTSHVHHYKWSHNRVMELEYLSTQSQYAKTSHEVLIVVNGLPYNDSTTKTLVATGSCAIDIVHQKTVTYRAISQNPSYYQYSNNQGTITIENVMDKGSGEAEVDAQA